MEDFSLLQPLLAGLSVGLFCLSYCFPFAGSLVAAEERPFKKNVSVVFQFLAGRLAGYLCFGIAAGYLGKHFESSWAPLATSFSFILLSAILFFYLIGLLKQNVFSSFCRRALGGKSPILLGFFMGMNLCPPFLLSVLFVFKQQNVLYGVFYFALFFLSSSIYFLPLIFLGFAARAREFRIIARLSGFLTALVFFVYGCYSILHYN